MAEKVSIPDPRYLERIARASRLVDDEGLDVLVANSNEADSANVGYISSYWLPLKMAGVAIVPSERMALMIGPESEWYARGRSKLDNIHLMTEYRESADPAYPNIPVSKYGDVFGSRTPSASCPDRPGGRDTFKLGVLYDDAIW